MGVDPSWRVGFLGWVLEVSGVVVFGEAGMSKGEGLCMWVIVWLIALIVYGLAGSSDLQTSADMTSGVNRAEVMAWAR